MLDFITSKIAMMVAAVIILSSVLGIYAWQREDAKDIELRNIADEISEAINGLSSLSAETKINITSDRSSHGIYVNPKVDGEFYEIIVTPTEVIIRQENRMFLRRFIRAIHLWEPDSDIYESKLIEEKDDGMSRIRQYSGEDIQIFRKLIDLNEGKEYMTFVYT